MNAIIFYVILKEISVIGQQDLGFLMQSFEKYKSRGSGNGILIRITQMRPQ